MTTINYYLKKIATDLFIRYSTTERRYITERTRLLKLNIKQHFGKEVSEVIVFGSYARGTNLPRGFDRLSDIDVLIVFDQSQGTFKTETYRNQLKRFVKVYYTHFPVQKSHPSIVLQMKKVMFDLVPARLQKNFFRDAYQIPTPSAEWVDTNPTEFSERLIKINKQYGSTIKPIVRLLKRWNAHNDYPYASYELEQHIAFMYFYGQNIQDVFLSVIQQLHTHNLTKAATEKVHILKNRGALISSHLKRDEQEQAMKLVNKILGMKYK